MRWVQAAVRMRVGKCKMHASAAMVGDVSSIRRSAKKSASSMLLWREEQCFVRVDCRDWVNPGAKWTVTDQLGHWPQLGLILFVWLRAIHIPTWSCCVLKGLYGPPLIFSVCVMYWQCYEVVPGAGLKRLYFCPALCAAYVIDVTGLFVVRRHDACTPSRDSWQQVMHMYSTCV